MKIKENKKGISLIVLVITIIVIIILVGSVILTLSNNNPIKNANEAKFKAKLDAYNSELSLTLSKKYIDNPNLSINQLDATTWDGIAPITGTIKEYISNMYNEDCKNYIIENGKLIYVGNDLTSVDLLAQSKMIPVVYKFDYTGNVQTFVAPVSTTYTLEVWGASGGGGSNQLRGSHKGLGGYSKGNITLSAGQTIYLYIGGQGVVASGIGTGGGWNGRWKWLY